MKAIRVKETGGPEVMKLEEVPDPVPAAGQIVVRIHAAGVNPVDTYFRAGGAYNPQLPYTPGMDGAGIVEAVGEGVWRVKCGDRVYTAGALSGTYAEKALCAEPQVQPLPECVSPNQGAGVYVPYATAYRALFQKACAKPGEWVLVHGASGGVGTAAVQIAVAAGMRVIGTAGTDRGLALVREQGAHHAIDHTKPEYQKDVVAVTGGQGPDVILEMLANVNLQRDLSMIAKWGRIVVIGSRGSTEIDARGTMARDVTIAGMVLMNAPQKELDVIHSALFAGMSNGTLRPVVGKEFPLADAPKAHEAVMAPGAYGKIVLIP